MSRVSYARHRFSREIIQHAVWLHFRFALSYRDVEDLLAERGVDVSYETVRRWVLKFGRAYPVHFPGAMTAASDILVVVMLVIGYPGRVPEKDTATPEPATQGASFSQRVLQILRG